MNVTPSVSKVEFLGIQGAWDSTLGILPFREQREEGKQEKSNRKGALKISERILGDHSVIKIRKGISFKKVKVDKYKTLH